jgi:hypothetical protein
MLEVRMKSLLEQLGIAFFGLGTTLVVVLLDVLFHNWTGIELAGISVNFIPFGALIAGGIAASGYYFGAKYTHNRANPSLLVLMILVAMLGEILIYWYEYSTMVFNGQRVRELISFSEYVSQVIRHTHLTFWSRGWHTDVGEVGWFSYVLAFRRFVGFVVGGLLVYLVLKEEKICPSCKLYLHTLGTGKRIFPDSVSES